MKNIIWLVDANMSLEHAAVGKVIQLSNAFSKKVDIVLDKRVRGIERWYLKNFSNSEALEDSVAAHQNDIALELSNQFDLHGVDYAVHKATENDHVRSVEQLLSDDSMLVVQASANVLRHPMLQMAKKFNCNILILKDSSWHRPLSIVSAIDPLHENDRPALLDDYIVKVSRSFKNSFKASWRVVHCCFVSPLFLEHKKRILEIHSDAVGDFSRKVGISSVDTTILQGVPETTLPDWLVRNKIDILCLGYIARNRLESYLVGSTTHSLMKAPPCDMLMVHQN